MRIALQIPRFHWQRTTASAPLASTLAQIARAADEAGFAAIWLMDHFFQIASIGKPEEEMLEAYTTLGFLAAHTSRVRLGTLVTGVHYRQPGVLIKQVTTLDVLSGGRACLGLGAGWYEREARGLGAAFPPLATRFALLSDTLQLAHHMWRADTTPFHGRQVLANEPLNVPPPLSQPHPPILVGGGGERTTLRLVAQYADACNLFARLPKPDLQRKLEVLQGYCAAAGRPYASVEKTALAQWNVQRMSAQAIVDQVGELRAIGFDTVIASLNAIETLTPIDVLARDVFPQTNSL
jgi:F420-dependent oxidoreductase-like protein